MGCDITLEKQYIDGYKSGDKRAFEGLMIIYQESAVAFARRYLKDEYMAEDIAQDAFAFTYVNRDKFNGKYSFKTYLFTIIKNRSVDYIRKNSRMSYFGGSHNEGMLNMNNISECQSPEDIHMESEEREELRRCIESLKDDYRDVIYLYEYEELSYKEIAKVLGKSTAQVKVTLFRARKKLKDIYQAVVENI